MPGYSLTRTPLQRNGSAWPVWLAPFDNTHLAPFNLRWRVPREPPPPQPTEYSVPELLP